MEKVKSRTLIDKVWDFFISVKLAIAIFAVLSITSIVGTKAIIAASTNKNKIAFEQKIEKLAGGLNG